VTWPGNCTRALICVTALLWAVLERANAQPSSVQPGVIERGEQQLPKPKASPDLTIPEVTAPAPDGSFDTIKLTLRDVVITGNAAIDLATLRAEFAPLIGRDVTLAQVFAAAQSITTLYAERGYALCLAYLPAQDIENGVVKVQVIEGYIETVETLADDPKLARVLSAYGDKIAASRPLKTAVLERYLLLANDLPGVRVRSVVDRGSGLAGAMKLILRVERRAWEASLTVENRGTQALGPERGRADVAVNGLISAREKISLSYMRGVDDKELDYLSGALSMMVGSNGSTISFEASNSNSQPGTENLSAIEFETRGFVGSVKASHPFVRARAQNLLFEGGFTHKDLKGDIFGLPNSDDRLTVASLTAHYDALDSWDGIAALDVTLSQGLDLFDASRAWDPLPSRVGADALFTRIELSASRVQALTEDLELHAAGSGQYADSALLSSEQCGYGGARYGRAFDGFEISGDHCAMAQVELRWRVAPPTEAIDHLQFFAFADAGWVKRRGLILPGESNEAGGQSAGVGLRLGVLEHVEMSLEYADPLGNEVALEGDADGRVFFSISIHR